MGTDLGNNFYFLLIVLILFEDVIEPDKHLFGGALLLKIFILLRLLKIIVKSLIY